MTNRKNVKNTISVFKYKVGYFNVKEYVDIKGKINNTVILTPNRYKHIITNHPEVEKYISQIKNILNKPDRVFLQVEKTNTLWITKKLEKNIKITLKINISNNKDSKYTLNSIITMQILKENRIEKYIEKGKIKELFQKDEI